MRNNRSWWLWGLVALSALLPATRAESPRAEAQPVCTLEDLHPIDVQIRLQQALVPNQWLTAEITLQSRVDLSAVRVLFERSEAVELLDAAKATPATLTAGVQSRQTVRVRVGDTREPQQVRLRVVGEHDGRPLERGATLHLLPQGPHHPGVLSETDGKHHAVIEYRGAARRVR